MKKISMLLALVIIIFSFSGCSPKTLSEDMKEKKLCTALFTKIGNPQVVTAKRLLNETEKALKTTEFSKIQEIPDVLQYFDKTVYFKTKDGKEYYALLKNIESNLELVRIRENNFMDGEVVWTNSDIDQISLKHNHE